MLFQPDYANVYIMPANQEFTPIMRPTPENGSDPVHIAPPEFFDKLDEIVVRTSASRTAEETRREAELEDPRNRNRIEGGGANISMIVEERGATSELPRSKPSGKGVNLTPKNQPLETTGREVTRRFDIQTREEDSQEVHGAPADLVKATHLEIAKRKWVERATSPGFLSQPVDVQEREAAEFVRKHGIPSSDV